MLGDFIFWAVKILITVAQWWESAVCFNRRCRMDGFTDWLVNLGCSRNKDLIRSRWMLTIQCKCVHFFFFLPLKREKMQGQQVEGCSKEKLFAFNSAYMKSHTIQHHHLLSCEPLVQWFKPGSVKNLFPQLRPYFFQLHCYVKMSQHENLTKNFSKTEMFVIYCRCRDCCSVEQRKINK